MRQRHGDDDRRRVAQRGEQEQRAVVFRQLEITGDGKADEEPEVHTGVVPQERRFAPIIVRQTLGEHHIDAGDVEAAAGQEHRQPQYSPHTPATAISAQPITCSTMPSTNRLRLLRNRPPR